MKKFSIYVSDMRCSSCVVKIEKALKNIQGITNVSVDFANAQVHIQGDEKLDIQSISKVIQKLGYTVKKSQVDSDSMVSEYVRLIICLLIGIVFFLQMIHLYTLNGIIQFFLALIVQVYGAYNFYKGSYKSLKQLTTNMDVLVAMGTTVAFLYSAAAWIWGFDKHLYFETSVFLITFINLGRVLEEFSKNRAKQGMKALLQLQAKQAYVEREGKITMLPIEEIKEGDSVLIKPGEKVPIDGLVYEGESEVDESMLTGESAPVYKKSNDKVFAGCVNGFGSLKVKVISEAKDSRLAQIIHLVNEAQSSKAPIQRTADLISAWFVPIVIVISVVTFIAWLIWGPGIKQAIMHSVATIIIACPCAIGLATPIVILVATSKAAKSGILIKDSQALEQAGKVDIVVFDKTGTITQGKLQVFEVITKSKEELLTIAASLAKLSEHPIAQAIYAFSQSHEKSVRDFISHAGKGVQGLIEEKKCLMGSMEFLKSLNIDTSAFEQKVMSDTAIISCVAQENKMLGYIKLSDPLKATGKQTIEHLHKLQIKSAILSGDRQQVVSDIASQLHIDKFYAQVSPEKKTEVIQSLKTEKMLVAMVGDGINDAPALAAADVAFAMASGTDVAMESANIGLMTSEPLHVVKAIYFSKKATKKIYQNFFFALIYNCLGIPLAAVGLIHPILAAVAMALSSICVVVNALSLSEIKSLSITP